MHSLFRGKSILHLAMAWILIVLVPAALAQSTSNLDRHARKIHKALAKYSSGSYVHLVFRDHSESSGALGALAPASFTITNTDSNAVETHSYSNVAHVTRERDYIGEGSESGRHFRLWVPITVAVLALGAAATAVEVR